MAPYLKDLITQRERLPFNELSSVQQTEIEVQRKIWCMLEIVGGAYESQRESL